MHGFSIEKGPDGLKLEVLEVFWLVRVENWEISRSLTVFSEETELCGCRDKKFEVFLHSDKDSEIEKSFVGLGVKKLRFFEC